MSKYILPAFIIIVILWAFIKKVPIYDNFVKGSKESIIQHRNPLGFVVEIISGVVVAAQIVGVFPGRWSIGNFCFHKPDVLPDFLR